MVEGLQGAQVKIKALLLIGNVIVYKDCFSVMNGVHVTGRNLPNNL